MAAPRFDLRRILACAAGTTDSDHALRAAARLADQLGASLDVLHVMKEPGSLGVLFTREQIDAMNAERAEKERARVQAHLAHRMPGLKVGGEPLEELVRVVPGNPSRTVLAELKRDPADLVVLGDSGRRKQLDFGGVARAVLSKSDVPVWLQVQEPRPVRRILAPTDLSEHAQLALSQTVALAKRLDAHVTVLHCLVEAEFAYVNMAEVPSYDPAGTLEQVRKETREVFDRTIGGFEWQGVPHDAVFVEDYAARTILARQDAFDLIAMGTHGRTGLAAALLGSVAHDVLRRAHTPVLALRDPKRSWLV